jgi:hypothetical protein
MYRLNQYYTLMIVAGLLGHWISILLNTYAHFIPTMQDRAAQLMDDILIPVPVRVETVNITIDKVV